jgi:hypothetical protein
LASRRTSLGRSFALRTGSFAIPGPVSPRGSVHFAMAPSSCKTRTRTADVDQLPQRSTMGRPDEDVWSSAWSRGVGDWVRAGMAGEVVVDEADAYGAFPGC